MKQFGFLDFLLSYFRSCILPFKRAFSKVYPYRDHKFSGSRYRCSRCHALIPEIGFTNYCGNCGFEFNWKGIYYV